MNDYTQDRRQHGRIPVRRSVLDSTEFTAIDLSESGMGLSCLSQQQPGKKIPLTLTLDGEKFELTGIVRWCHPAASIFNTGYNLGVEFEGYSASQLLAIRAYIKKMQAKT